MTLTGTWGGQWRPTGSKPYWRVILNNARLDGKSVGAGVASQVAVRVSADVYYRGVAPTAGIDSRRPPVLELSVEPTVGSALHTYEASWMVVRHD